MIVFFQNKNMLIPDSTIYMYIFWQKTENLQ